MQPQLGAGFFSAGKADVKAHDAFRRKVLLEDATAARAGHGVGGPIGVSEMPICASASADGEDRDLVGGCCPGHGHAPSHRTRGRVARPVFAGSPRFAAAAREVSRLAQPAKRSDGWRRCRLRSATPQSSCSSADFVKSNRRSCDRKHVAGRRHSRPAARKLAIGASRATAIAESAACTADPGPAIGLTKADFHEPEIRRRRGYRRVVHGGPVDPSPAR